MSDLGPVESAVRADVGRFEAEAVGVQRSLAETAYTLAGQLDQVRWLSSASAGMAAAALAKELRATLDALIGVGDDADRTAEILAQLSSPVGDSEGPVA